jgi:chromosome segregation protein
LLIREIILENFMSYEYARIPLKPGLNVVCGPNGAGKSSILLAISVALGQSYTERSRKLSDLIRWGKDSARVTLVFDNTPSRGRRPVSRFDVDYFRISRYIRRDGDYWFEANFESVNKNEISDIFRGFGLNPDNMLIIMHQNMMEEFGMTSSQQKLRMVEDAVGLGRYRSNIMEAHEKLEQVLSEEESVKSLLGNAEQTLDYWKREYEKYQQRQKLLEEKEYLERELIWARILKQESVLKSWEVRIKRSEAELADVLSDMKETEKDAVTAEASLKELHRYYLESFYTLLNNEKELTRYEITAEVLERSQQRLSNLESTVLPGSDVNLSRRQKYIDDMKKEMVFSIDMAREQKAKTAKNRSELTKLEDRIEYTTQLYLEKKIRMGILEFRQRTVKEALTELSRELSSARKVLDDLKPLTEKAGSRIEASRSIQDVSEELKILGVRLAGLGEISQEVEKMYFHYLSIIDELKTKASLVDENLKKTMEEIEERRRKWRESLESLLGRVSQTYGDFLAKIEATGRVRLVNTDDMEEVGLELLVGFRGAEPQVLDAFTQSGGERSVATMLFLIALQQYLRSPFRAVDEFDVHMDPRNREVISEMLLDIMSEIQDTQYVTITPGQITAVKGTVHVITVQSVSGRSEVMVVG